MPGRALTLPRAHLALGEETGDHIDTSQLSIRLASAVDYWPLADLHSTVFDTDVNNPGDALWKRFDRIFALQINDDLQNKGAGQAVCLVATLPAPYHATSTSPLWEFEEDAFEFPKMGYWLRNMTHKDVRKGMGRSYQADQVVGVAQLDTFGDLVPPKSLDGRRDGAFGWFRRDGYGYISNVAVAPHARRSGVAARLMAEAEALAADWGCKKACLHCNAKNTPAVELYMRSGYRRTILEPAWMPFIQGRAPDRCHFMVKLLPQATPAHPAAAGAGQEEGFTASHS